MPAPERKLRRTDVPEPFGELVVDVAEAVREVERLAGRDVLLDRLPDDGLRGVGREHHDHVALRGGLFDGEERLARHPAVLDRALPARIGLRGLALADDHVDAVVPHVERLARTLDAIAKHRDRLALEDLLGLLEREFLARYDFLDDAAEIDVHLSLLLFSPLRRNCGIV